MHNGRYIYTDINMPPPLHVKQEKILPRPNDISEDLLGDFWNSLDVLLQLNTLIGDEIVNQTAVNNSAVLGPFLTPVSTQLLSWVGCYIIASIYQ